MMRIAVDTPRTLARALIVAVGTLVLGSLAACGGGSDSASTPTPAASAPVTMPPAARLNAGTWAVIGSSTAEGAGAPPDNGWVSLLKTAYANRGAQVGNLAKGGSVTYHGLSAAAPAVAGRPAADPDHNIDRALALNPVLVIVSYPTNDTALGYSVDETVNNILAIRAHALTANVPVIVTSPQPRNLTVAQLAQLRSIDERLAAAVGPCFVEVYQALAAGDGRLASEYDSGDGVHPNGAGHQIIANRVQTIIDSQKCVITSAP